MSFKVPPQEAGLPKQSLRPVAAKSADPLQLNDETPPPQGIDGNKAVVGTFAPKDPQAIADRIKLGRAGLEKKSDQLDVAPGWEFLQRHPVLTVCDAEDKTFLVNYTRAASKAGRDTLKSLLNDARVKAAPVEEQAKLLGWFLSRGFGRPYTTTELVNFDAVASRLVVDFEQNEAASHVAGKSSASSQKSSMVFVPDYPFFESAKPGDKGAQVTTISSPGEQPFTIALPATAKTPGLDTESLRAILQTLPKPLKELVRRLIIEPNANPYDNEVQELVSGINASTTDELLADIPEPLRPVALSILKKHMPEEVNPQGAGQAEATATAEGEIRMYPVMSTDIVYMALALRHELAHTFSERQRGYDPLGPGWADWQNAEMADLAFVSRYSMASPVEDYAETAAIYLTVLGTPDEEAARKQFPSRFDILDREFQDADMQWWVQRKISGAKKKPTEWVGQQPGVRVEKKR